MKHNIGRRITSMGGKVVTKQKTERTPGPWELKPESNIERPDMLLYSPAKLIEGAPAIATIYVDSEEDEANAAFIVKAVNMHDDLVEALKRAKNDLVLWNDGHCEEETISLIEDINALLAKAEVSE